MLNKNLLTLKCVLFLFFGAVGALLPFIPLQMNVLGLSRDEAVIVSSISPLIALIGPLVAAPLADRLAGGFGGAPRSKTGRYLRIMISLCCILATIFYWLLVTIPPIIRDGPPSSFMCDKEGGFILQERFSAENTCYDWGSRKGAVMVKNCIFTCNVSSSYKVESSSLRSFMEGSSERAECNCGTGNVVGKPEGRDAVLSNCTCNDTSSYKGDSSTLTSFLEASSERTTYDYILEEPEGYAPPEEDKKENYVALEPYPHMCFQNASGDTVCEVYTNNSYPIKFTLGLKSAVAFNGSDTENTCKYPFDKPFHCRIPPGKATQLKDEFGEGNDCKPAVLCEIHDPFNTNSFLRRSQGISFWLYLFTKSFGDMFLAAAVVLLGTAVVIATRETSTGRGDVGKQFAVGALGFAIFAPIIGGCANGRFFEGMICFTVLMVLAVIILLADEKMPLSPPEWWWHTRCGLLALPMSAVRKYGLETAALGIVLLLLGVFWNSIDSFLAWHVVRIRNGVPLVIGLTITVGALPAVPFLICAEKIVDYCGHSNILIFCFVNYICHHLTLMCIDNANLLYLCEILEIFTLHVMYVTAVLYLRHLVPRKLTACGQALPIVAHFCLGRCIGALLGGIAYNEYPYKFNIVHRWFTVAAAIVAFVYFVAYHFYMKPKCGAPVHLPPDPAPAFIQSTNGNGFYTPLRVYHNSKSKKGHFRY